MELVPNLEVKSTAPDEKQGNSSVKAVETEIQKDSGFKSDAHEFAVTEFREAMKSGDIESQKLAERVAESMGASDRYTENPFQGKAEAALYDAFVKGEKKQELQREEARIVLDDSMEMSDD